MVYVFTDREIKDLLISAITIAFIVAYPHLNPITFLFYLLVVGLGFIAHEMAHKLEAQRHGAWSEFVMWPTGLLLSVIFRVLFGSIIILPGATYWAKPFATREEEARVAAAGPIASIAISLLFLLLSFIYKPFLIGAYVNAFIAAFNLIPFGPLDGAKIIRVYPGLWAFLFLSAIIIMKIV